MQVNRLFEIIYILLERQTVTAKEFAERFEVSSRTIYRDIETLSAAGIPIYMSKGKGGGISLVSGFVLDKAVLTKEEKNNILTSLTAFSAVGLSERTSALDKLTALLGGKCTDWVEVDFSNWSHGSKDKKLFYTIKDTIINQIIIQLSYSNGKGESSIREVEPLKLCFKGQDWYLYGFCKLKNDFRFFKLRRITDLIITGKQFEREIPKQIFTDTKQYVQTSEPIKLRISKSLAYRVYDEFPHYRTDENGDFIVDIIDSDPNWTYSYVGTFGSKAEIIEPENIRNNYIKLLQDSLKIYL